MRIGEARHQRLQQHHSRHIAHNIAENRGHHGEHSDVLKIPVVSEIKQPLHDPGVFRSTHDHEQADEEDQQSPVDLLVQLMGINRACDQQDGSAEGSHLRGDTPIKNPTRTAVTTMAGLVRREASSAGNGITSASTSCGAAARICNQCSTAQSISSPMSATGAKCSRKSRYLIPEKEPISMFCGLPVMVATLPIFEAVATASR